MSLGIGHSPTVKNYSNPTRGPFLDGECVNDPEHQWVGMHLAWNGGANDNWLPAQATTRAGPYVPLTMGYYTRQDIPIHYLLADTFTICDGYHCSLLTGTLPNRLYWLSANIDPAGTDGGPQLVEPGFLPLQQFSWRIMPENLEDAGVSWKVYQNKGLGRFINTPISNNGLVQAFRQAADPRSNLARYGIAPTYPGDFAADVRANRLPNGVGECVNDPDHQWIAAHLSWNGGANDGWLPAQARTRSVANTPVVMGYYARPDIPIHYLLADTFTICDQYFSSLLGGTMPNRLYWISATVNPDGDQGGPQIVEPAIQPKLTFTWRIMPQNLSDAGISWKVYNSKLLGGLNDTSLSRNGYVGSFKQAADPRSDLARYGIAPAYPWDFIRDVINNTLPQVSWVVPLTVESEHPSFPVAVGAVTIVNLIRVLLRNPAVWEKTALIIAYDEHGGFFDHVTPLTAPEGTPGEWIPNSVDIDKVDGSGGIRGPIGLGFRVPCFVISPYSRGGLMVHDRFDHTSQLQLIGKRFGVPVPNLTPWRASVTGDMTSAFNFAAPPDPSPPNLDHPVRQLPKVAKCVPNVVLGFLNEGLPYRVPYPQTTPVQESGPARPIPSGIC